MKSVLHKYVFSIVILFTISCSNDIQTVELNFIKGDKPDIEITNYKTSYYVNKYLKARIFAPKAKKYILEISPFIEFPQGVKVIFYDENGQLQTTLRADYAIYYESKKLWEARGNVIVKNKDGARMRTQQLFGDENQRKVYSVRKVDIVDADGSVYHGKGGFESNFEFTNYIFKNVDGQIKVHEEFTNENGEPNNIPDDKTPSEFIDEDFDEDFPS